MIHGRAFQTRPFQISRSTTTSPACRPTPNSSHTRAGNGSRPAPCSRSILIWQHALRIVRFVPKVCRSIHSPARARDELAAAIRAHAVHRAGAPAAERALVRADPRGAVGGQTGTAALAHIPH